MTVKIRCVVAALACAAWACTSGDQDPPGTGGMAIQGAAGTAPGGAAAGAGAGLGAAGLGSTGTAGGGEPAGSGSEQPAGQGAGAAGTAEPGTGGAGTDEPVPSGVYDYAMEEVTLSADLHVAAGETLRVGPGVTFTAAMNVKVLVEGTLIAEGTAAAPVRFLGAGMPRSWHGIVVASGGSITLTHVEIGGATYGILAQPGSDFSVDYADIGTSFKAAVVQSDGSFDHTKFHASGDPTFSPVNEVSIDDVNGTLTVIDASPTVTNASFDGSAALVDMVRIGGNSSPVFDHVHVKDAHCGFHTFGMANSAPRISNTVFERLAYGIMAYTMKATITDSVFMGNANDVGFCFGATADNTPTLMNNFYASGAAVIDASCFQIGADEPNPAATANPGAGPAGL